MAHVAFARRHVGGHQDYACGNALGGDLMRDLLAIHARQVHVHNGNIGRRDKIISNPCLPSNAWPTTRMRGLRDRASATPCRNMDDVDNNNCDWIHVIF